jgi:hypothetical protein
VHFHAVVRIDARTKDGSYHPAFVRIDQADLRAALVAAARHVRYTTRIRRPGLHHHRRALLAGVRWEDGENPRGVLVGRDRQAAVMGLVEPPKGEPSGAGRRRSPRRRVRRSLQCRG